MAGMKIPGRVSKVKRKLGVGASELEKAIEAETEGMLDPQQAKKREAEIRNMFFAARKKTKGLQSGILMGLFGEDVGQALANIFAKEDAAKIKNAQKFFAKYKKDEKNKLKIKQKQAKEIAKLVGKQRFSPEISETSKQKVSIKRGFYFDPEVGAKGGIRNVKTGRFASEEQAVKRKERTDRLTKAIGADEEPLVLLRERFDTLVKSVGIDTAGKSVHEKLDDLIDQVETGGGGFGIGNLLGIGGRGAIRARRGGIGARTKVRGRSGALKRFMNGGGPVRDAKGRFVKRGGVGGFGMRGLLAGGVGAAAGGYLGYKAVDMLRDEGLTQYDPELLKKEAIAAREAGDTEYSEALKTQIGLQKKDVALRAGAEVAGVAGAGLGAVAGVKVAQKVVKNKGWNLFVKFIQKRAPKLAAKVGTRLAAAGAMATVPIAGWIGAIISLGFAASTAYDLYQLWIEFSALSDAEKETAASGKPSKEVNDWAYSVFVGKAKLENVPGVYREQVDEILKKPPANWRKPQKSVASAAKPIPSAPTTTASTTKPTAAPGTIASAFAAVKETVQKAVGAGAQASMATGAAISAAGAVAAGGKTTVDKVKDIIVDAAKRVGVNPGIMLAMGQQESSFNPSAQPYDKKTGKLLSSAKGIFQFINSTWDSMVKKYSDAYPELLRGALDPTANALAGALYVKENSQFLQKSGIPVTGTSIYATHFLGPGGAAKLFSAAKQSIAAEVVPQAAKSNPHIFLDKSGAPKTVEEVIDTLYKKVGSKAETFQAQVDSGKIGGVPSSISGVEPQSMLAATSQTPTPVMSASAKPAQSTIGTEATQQSREYASNKLVAQTTPPPVIVNNTSGENQQPIIPPKQSVPKASARSNENAFNRALARDFSHPSAFTSVGLV